MNYPFWTGVFLGLGIAFNVLAANTGIYMYFALSLLCYVGGVCLLSFKVFPSWKNSKTQSTRNPGKKEVKQ